nr:translation initiation factor [Alishewanella tabrizica]
MVYSTEHGRIAPATAAPIKGERYTDGALRIKRETKGRGGKTVLIITGLMGTPAELSALCTDLKKRCACGGAVKEGHIEIQADKREFVAELLQQKGYKVKQAGG